MKLQARPGPGQEPAHHPGSSTQKRLAIAVSSEPCPTLPFHLLGFEAFLLFSVAPPEMGWGEGGS